MSKNVNVRASQIWEQSQVLMFTKKTGWGEVILWTNLSGRAHSSCMLWGMNETLGKTNSSSICNKYVVIVSVCYLENILRMKSHTLIKEDDCIKDVCTDFSPILPLPLRLPLFPFSFWVRSHVAQDGFKLYESRNWLWTPDHPVSTSPGLRSQVRGGTISQLQW